LIPGSLTQMLDLICERGMWCYELCSSELLFDGITCCLCRSQDMWYGWSRATGFCV